MRRYNTKNVLRWQGVYPGCAGLLGARDLDVDAAVRLQAGDQRLAFPALAVRRLGQRRRAPKGPDDLDD